MKGAQRDGVLVMLLVGALMAILGVAGMAMLLGCKGDDVPGIGPTVRSAHPSQHARLLRAIDVAGDALQTAGLVDPALIVDLTVFDGDSFAVTWEEMDGASLWGHNDLVLGVKGLRCEDAIASRQQDVNDLRPSGLSLAHEMAHCALDVMVRPDSKHEDRAIWDVIVPAVNARLAAEGL